MILRAESNDASYTRHAILCYITAQARCAGLSLHFEATMETDSFAFRTDIPLRSHHRRARGRLGGQLNAKLRIHNCENRTQIRDKVVGQAGQSNAQAILVIWDHNGGKIPGWAFNGMADPHTMMDTELRLADGRYVPIFRVIGADIGVPIAKMTEKVKRCQGRHPKKSVRSPKTNSMIGQPGDLHTADSPIVMDSNTWCTMVGGAMLEHLHERFGIVQVIVYANDYSIPPCGPAGMPLTTVAYDDADETMTFQVRQGLYTEQINNILYTMRLAYDDSSYIFLPATEVNEPLMQDARANDEQAVHLLTEWDLIITQDAVEYARLCSPTKAWHYLEYLAAYLPQQQTCPALEARLNTEDALRAHHRALGRPIRVDAFIDVQEAVRNNNLAIAAGKHITHPTRLLPALRRRILLAMWEELGRHELLVPTIPIMPRAFAIDSCYVAWHREEPLLHSFSVFRIAGIHVLAPRKFDGTITILQCRAIISDVPGIWPEPHFDIIDRCLTRHPHLADARDSWTCHIGQYRDRLTTFIPEDMDAAGVIHLKFNATSPIPIKYRLFWHPLSHKAWPKEHLLLEPGALREPFAIALV